MTGRGRRPTNGASFVSSYVSSEVRPMRRRHQTQFAMPRRFFSHFPENFRLAFGHNFFNRVHRALRILRPSSRSTPLMRVCAVKGIKRGADFLHVPAANPVFIFRQDDDAPPFGSLVGKRDNLGGVRQSRPESLLSVDINSNRLPVSQSDRPGFCPKAERRRRPPLPPARPDMAITLA